MGNSAEKPSLPFLCYHGSPGSPDDFGQLAKALPERRLVRLVRRGYPLDGYGGVDTPSEQSVEQVPAIYVGYSWGARCCLHAAAQSPDLAKGLVLIAPFLRASNPLGAIKRTLIGLGALGRILVSTAAKDAAQELLSKTCRPVDVPQEYRAMQSWYQRPDVLQRALLEKEEASPLEPSLAILGNAKIPTLIVWTKTDACGCAEQHVEPLRKVLRVTQDIEIEGAGHAIPWTHAVALAEHIRSFVNTHVEGTP